MTDIPSAGPTPVSETSIAKHHAPDGRLSPEQAATPEFALAADAAGPDETSVSVDAADTEQSGDAARFDAIKAECRYCGQSLDADHSL